MEFHHRIACMSGNPIFDSLSCAMLGWLQSYHTELLIWTGREQITLAEHEEILRAITARDADAAEAAMVAHLERSRALYALKSAEDTAQSTTSTQP